VRLGLARRGLPWSPPRRLRPDGAAIGMPLDAVGGDWIVARGPWDARVSPDGLKAAYWFTGRRLRARRGGRPPPPGGACASGPLDAGVRCATRKRAFATLPSGPLIPTVPPSDRL